MGEFYGTPLPTETGFDDTTAQADKIAADHASTDGGEEGWDTGIEVDGSSIKAAAEKGGLPVFDVSHDEFYKNMKIDRRKMVFKRGTPQQKYHAGTNYKQHFWVRNKEDGHIYRIGK
jgi:hypothetical protein